MLKWKHVHSSRSRKVVSFKSYFPFSLCVSIFNQEYSQHQKNQSKPTKHTLISDQIAVQMAIAAQTRKAFKSITSNSNNQVHRYLASFPEDIVNLASNQSCTWNQNFTYHAVADYNWTQVIHRKHVSIKVKIKTKLWWQNTNKKYTFSRKKMQEITCFAILQALSDELRIS